MNQRGFTLIEQIVVLGIMGILLSIVAINFNAWLRKSQIEKQTREFNSDLNTARTESVFRKRRHSIVMNGTAKGYAFKRYSSENESLTTGGTDLFTKSTSYQFSTEDGSSAANQFLAFDIRGFAITDSDLVTIRINPVNSGAAFDCVFIDIARSRIKIGKMEGASCVQK
jgi:type II secretion system protein H